MATVIGDLLVRISGNASGLKDVVRTTEGSLGSLDRNIAGVVKSIGKYAVALTGIAAGITFALVKTSLDAIDAQSKLAYKLGGTVAGLQALQYAADLAGVEAKELEQAASRMAQRLGEAAREGAGPTYEALRRLGLSAKDLIKLDVDERLAVISDRFRDLGYNTAQQADALRDLGVRGGNLINLLEGGGDAIRKAKDDVRAFGVEVSRIDAIKIEQANDAWTTAKKLFEGIANTIAVTLAPLITHLGDEFAAAGRETGGFKEAIKSLFLFFVESFATMNMMVYRLRRAVAEFQDTVSFGARNVLKEFDKMTKPPASADEWKKWLDEIDKKYSETAEKVAASRDKMFGSGGAKIDPLTTEQKDALNEKLLNLKAAIASEDEALRLQRDKQLKDLQDLEQKKILTVAQGMEMRKQIQAKFDQEMADLIQSKLEENVLKEDEILTRAYEKRLRDLGIFEQNKTITTEKANELRRKQEEKYQMDLIQLQASQYSRLAGIVDTSLSQISQLIGKEGGAAFNIMKGISMATALVKGYEAVVSAIAFGNSVGGPAVGAAFGAIAAAGVAAQIALLAATKPGSTGPAPGTGSRGAGTAAAAQTSATSGGGGSNQTLTVSGFKSDELYSGEMVRALAQKLVDFQRDGGKLVIA